MILLLATTASCWAEEWRWEATGSRFGFSYRETDDYFIQTEGFASLDLPRHWELGRDWSLHPLLDFSAGWLSGRDADGFVGTVGPALRFGRERLPLEFIGGISLTILSRENFGSKDFGSYVQFTSYAGLSYRLGSHVQLGYRYQHMSNANLGHHNPGLNLNMFTLAYRF